MSLDNLKTLCDILRTAMPSSPAVIVASQPSRIYTREMILQFIQMLSSKFASLGISTGDAVCLVTTNTIEYIVSFFAVANCRATAQPLNAAYKREEFEWYISDINPKLIVVDGTCSDKETIIEAAGNLQLPLFVINMTELSPVITLHHRSPCDAREYLVSNNEFSPDPDDVALYLHTSGTTSAPKGVPLKHRNLIASVKNIIGTYDLCQGDRDIIVMPLFHVHGLVAGLMSSLAAGGTVILPEAGKFSASTFYRDALEHGITWYTAVPTIHQILLKTAEDSQGQIQYSKLGLRFIRSCSASLPPSLLAKIEEAFMAPVLEAYAMTEAAHQMTSNPLPSRGPHKPGTVGQAQGGVSVTILNLDTKLPCPNGVAGEISIKGTNVFSGYKGRPLSDAFNEEGWFGTGDMGVMDEDGYVTITGRIKELINRGGEKISAAEVDAVLLSHPDVIDAVAFPIPHDMYGEEVAASVVLKSLENSEAVKENIIEHMKKTLAPFKIPKRFFLYDQPLPRSATGKIQRNAYAKAMAAEISNGIAGNSDKSLSKRIKGSTIIAKALRHIGVQYIFGVIGIPVTAIACEAQKEGIRYIGFRNEQAAGYAASAVGFITGRPAVLLTVSGPGLVHGLAGLANATVNGWPMLMLSGSIERDRFGHSGFQELDQVKVASSVPNKGSFQLSSVTFEHVTSVFEAALKSSISGSPGGVYVDLPADIICADAVSDFSTSAPINMKSISQNPDLDIINEAVLQLRFAKRPLIIIGTEAAMHRLEDILPPCIQAINAPFLALPMARGVISDSHQLNGGASRSLVLKESDVVFCIGSRLSWQLHFGDSPKFDSNCKFILALSAECSSDNPVENSALKIIGDISKTVTYISNAMHERATIDESVKAEREVWVERVKSSCTNSINKLEGVRSKALEIYRNASSPMLGFHVAMTVIRNALNSLQDTDCFIVSEGANTMDFGRILLPAPIIPRRRLDAGYWGTMGVGLGYAIASAVSFPSSLVVAVEGDSAFGFSGMEIETIARYNLPVVVIIFNNGGVYGGDRRTPEERFGDRFPTDPSPTDLNPKAQHNLIMAAFGGLSYHVKTLAELESACNAAFTARSPALIDISIDPTDGKASGRLEEVDKKQTK